MTLALKLDDALSGRLAALAEAAGVSGEQFARGILESYIGGAGRQGAPPVRVAKPPLGQFLMESPLRGSGLVLERDRAAATIPEL